MQSNSESQFTHLRCHSEFSIKDGIVRLKDYVNRASEKKLTALAITDLSNVFAAVKFFKLATSQGIKPIIGLEAYFVEDRHEKKFTRDRKDKRFRQVFLAKNREGYENLAEMCSLGFIEGYYYNFS